MLKSLNQTESQTIDLDCMSLFDISLAIFDYLTIYKSNISNIQTRTHKALSMIILLLLILIEYFFYQYQVQNSLQTDQII
jgi:hypothetical protein